MRSSIRPANARPRLLFFVTEDWYLWSHRLNIADAAQAAGYEVIVVTRVNAYGDRLRTRGFRVISIHLQRGRIFSLMEFRTLAEIIAIYRRERPDLVHHVGLKPVLYGGIAAALAGVPARVNALGGLGYIFMTSRLHLRAIRLIIRLVLRGLLSARESWLILQNTDDLNLFQANRVGTPGRTLLIRGSGVDVEAMHPTPEPPAPLVAAQVSRMIADKGIPELVEAARLLRARGVPLHIRLVGPIDSENPSAIPAERLERWTREGLIEWIGPVEDIAQLWRSTHIAVLASHREGLSKSLLEAGACARPIVATDVPGNREVVTDGKTGLLVPCRAPAALAAALERLCGDAALRETLGRNVRDLIAREFADRRVVSAILGLYRHAAGEAQDPPAAETRADRRSCAE